MSTTTIEVRGQEDRGHAYCVGSDYGEGGTWPGSCCAPATHALRSLDAGERPYESHYCSRHVCSGPFGPTYRYRSDAEAATALADVLAHIEAMQHPNDAPASMARCRERARVAA